MNNRQPTPLEEQARQQAEVVVIEAFRRTDLFQSIVKEQVADILNEFQRGEKKVQALSERITQGLFGDNQPLRIGGA